MTPATPHAGALRDARSAADFAAIIALLDTDLNSAIDQRHALDEAEDRAIFGDGDLAAVRAQIAECDAAIALLEKSIDGARTRRTAAEAGEAAADIEALGADIKAKAAALGERWRGVQRLVEELRGELFEADALNRAVTLANGQLDTVGRPDLKINLTAARRAAMAGPRAVAPTRLSRPAVQADKLLLSFLSPGGALDLRASVGAPVNGVDSKFIPATRG